MKGPGAVGVTTGSVEARGRYSRAAHALLGRDGEALARFESAGQSEGERSHVEGLALLVERLLAERVARRPDRYWTAR